MIFRQLYEPVSSTYTYLLGCEETGRAVLIDPVINSVERDLAEVSKLGLKLEYTLDTHIHADHITSARELKQKAGSKIAAPAMDCLPCTDVGVEEGRPFQVGRLSFQPIHTPGHTDGHFAYRLDDRIFTGDALLIEVAGVVEAAVEAFTGLGARLERRDPGFADPAPFCPPGPPFGPDARSAPTVGRIGEKSASR